MPGTKVQLARPNGEPSRSSRNGYRVAAEATLAADEKRRQLHDGGITSQDYEEWLSTWETFGVTKWKEGYTDAAVEEHIKGVLNF
jgi:hypothetical protein